MRKMVYKFLDEYLGNEFYSKTIGKETYIYSKKISERIMFYWVNGDLTKITMFRPSKLNEFVASFCNITIEESNQYVKDWFGDRANIKKVNDLLKYHNNN
jgi:hypothetical protein